MRRRDFLGLVGAALWGPPALADRAAREALAGRAGGGVATWLLIPMDDVQSNHLKAYGVTYRVLERGG